MHGRARARDTLHQLVRFKSIPSCYVAGDATSGATSLGWWGVVARARLAHREKTNCKRKPCIKKCARLAFVGSMQEWLDAEVPLIKTRCLARIPLSCPLALEKDALQGLVLKDACSNSLIFLPSSSQAGCYDRLAFRGCSNSFILIPSSSQKGCSDRLSCKERLQQFLHCLALELPKKKML